jgi:hypothetical protein
MFCIGQTDRIRGLLADSGESQGIYRVNLWDANEQRVWIDLNGGVEQVDGNATHSAWRALLGPSGQFGQHFVSGWSNQQIWDLICGALQAGKQVNIASRSDIGNYRLPDGTTLVKNHVYWVDACAAGPPMTVNLVNPHGAPADYYSARVPFDLLNVLIRQVIILDVLS